MCPSCNKILQGTKANFRELEIYLTRKETIWIERINILVIFSSVYERKVNQYIYREKATHKSARWLWRSVTRDIREEK